MTEKRFKADKYFEIWDNDDFLLSFDQTVDLLNQLNEENEQLKQSVNNLKDTIVTIGIAYQKKHGGTLVDLVDGTLEENIIDLGTDL